MSQELVAKYFQRPIFALIEEAHEVLKKNPLPFQKAKLLSIKTGGCPEDCAYCAQSSYYQTSIKKERLISVEEVFEKAQRAKEEGATRFCLGGAYRKAPQGEDFQKILEMVKKVRSLGLECCLTVGMLTEDQVAALKEAGLSAYNHNLDTSASFYSKIITTRTYQERLNTLTLLAKYNIAICCGLIIGLGESELDYQEFLQTLLELPKAPESIPLNLLIPVPGTPLEKNKIGDREKLSLLKMVALCRILFPKSYVRISAGRKSLTTVEQVLLFYAGANSLFLGERLLTQENVQRDTEEMVLQLIKNASA